MNFDYFQIQKSMFQTVWVEKVDEKKGNIFSRNAPQNSFFKFCSDLSKKSESIKAIYIYPSESSFSIISENGMVYMDPSHRSWDTSN